MIPLSSTFLINNAKQNENNEYEVRIPIQPSLTFLNQA